MASSPCPRLKNCFDFISSTIEERFSAAPASSSERVGFRIGSDRRPNSAGGDVAILLGMDILLSWLVTTRPGFPDPRFTLLAGVGRSAAVSRNAGLFRR